MNAETKVCQNCQQNFVIEPEDFEFYEKMDAVPPVHCPDCRFRQRTVFRNEYTLYKQSCSLCSKPVVTMYNPKSPYTVYCNDCYVSDKWDPFSYGMEYDPSRPFFYQLAELVRKVPKSATYSSAEMGPNINSEYTNFASANKDCYLIFNSGPNNENCAYARGLMNTRDTFDAYFGEDLERVYEVINAQKCSNVAWGQNVLECLDSSFLLNCSGCTNCFGSVNLKHKSYYFFNEPLSKEEYEKRVGEIRGSYSKTEETKKRFEAHALKYPRRENTNLRSVGCVGDYIFNSKNARQCFEVSDGEDIKYAFSPKGVKDSYDIIGHGRNSELLLECVGVGVSQRVIGSWWVANTHDVEYCFAIRSGANLLGCDSVKGEYCILNKKYSREEYNKIRSQIVKELKEKGIYGHFLPLELALFAYNECIGQDNMPLTKEEALKFGFRWEDEIPRTKEQETIMPDDIPDHINDVPESIINEVLKCISCGYNYRVIPAELEFYRRSFVPVPRQCFICRHRNRIASRGPMKVYARVCAKCGKEISTNYAPDRPEIVYCEQCYQAEVV